MAEFWLQLQNGSKKILHAVVDAAGHTYAEKMQMHPGENAKAELLPTAPFASEIKQYSDGWSILLTLPRSELKGDTLAFNIMRNRSCQGTLSNYTTVPGNSYFCGEVFFLDLN